MDDSVEGPNAAIKQKIEGRGSLRKWSFYSIYIYIRRKAARAINMVGIKFCECLFIIYHSGRATIFYFHKHVSRLETSISRIFLVCLTRWHIMRLAALLCIFTYFVCILFGMPSLQFKCDCLVSQM